MTGIASATATQTAITARTQAATGGLDQAAFLRLMTAQMNAQDPFNPMDNTQMVAQMAQFSSVAGIAEMNVALRSITQQIGEQTSLLAELVARFDAGESTTTPEVSQGA